MPKHDKRLIYPQYPKNQVRRAGESVRNGNLNPEAEKIIENWRCSHNHILNTWLVIFIKRIQNEGFKAVVGQRLKRKNTIYDKLTRPETNKMSLERMYDIAGCRIVLDTLGDLYDFRDSIINSTRFYHKRIKKYHKNYIRNPKGSGYRGIHDVYSYQCDPKRTSNNWNGLFIEIQYRTKYQHAWSTAVEIADIIKHSRTKFSDVADKEQNIYFQYASEIIARVYEDSKSCCQDMSDAELVSNFLALESKLNMLKILGSMKVLKMDIPESYKRALIIRLYSENNEIKIEVHTFKSTAAANRRLFELEKAHPDDDIVLVKADKVSSIKNIFKNYFVDAGDFVKYIKEGIKALHEGRRLIDVAPDAKRKRKTEQLALFEE